MKILIGADLVPTSSNEILFSEGKINDIIDPQLLSILQNADYRIFNIEVPLTNEITPIDKYGKNLSAKTSTICGIKKIGVNFFTLANNHILDQGEQGLFSTIETLKSADISFAGAGENLEEAKKPFILEMEGKKIGIYCCTEHEFSIATDISAGTNPFNSLDSLDNILQLKEISDYVIVLYHGGNENYAYPSPLLQKRCRRMADKGADLILCQHSHCIGCEEKYNSSTIVYGQGNFIFDLLKIECWNTSLLICLEFENNCPKISYIPLCKDNNGVKLANKKESENILSGFYKRSEEIKSPIFLNQKYSELAEDNLLYFLSSFQGSRLKSALFRILNKLSKNKLKKIIFKKYYKKKNLLCLQNLIECETHRDLLIHALKQNIRKNIDE